MSQESAPSQGVAPLPTGRAADPAVYSSQLLGEDAEGAALATSASKPPPKTAADEYETLVPPKPPHSSSHKLEHTEVGLPSKPNNHQKRSVTNQSAQPQQSKVLNEYEITCVGLDGSPWPDDVEGQKAQEADNKEYFKDHKASPLSEIEFVDTRKPVTQATDHKVDNPEVGSYYGGGVEGTVWWPEQLETAEETMLRANQIWQWNKMRGDPESPHGKVLRALRHENW